MKAGRWLSLAALAIVVVLPEGKALAGGKFRDSSGAAMQRHNSSMMSSPMRRFPSRFSRSFWPWVAYTPAPSMTIVNVHVHVPVLDERPAPPPPPPAPSKFWIARCGSIVELEVSETMNLMEEEQKPCSP